MTCGIVNGEGKGGRGVTQNAPWRIMAVNVPAFLIVLKGKMSSSTVSMAGHVQNVSLISAWYPGSVPQLNENYPMVLLLYRLRDAMSL
jgi:Asp-tRNA(Asn)/Glu-tRNA(Gln) amidotransferase B subunit